MTTYRHGQFVWREIMTTDVEASKRFYAAVFGWQYEAVESSGATYYMGKLGDQRVSGLLQHPHAGAPPYWGTAISVADVEATVARVTSAGGTIIVPPTDAGTMGRFSYFIDPQGAATSVWKGTQGDAPLSTPPKVGEFCWEQLNTNNLDGSLAFYAKVFDWVHKPFAGDDNQRVFWSGDVQVASVLSNPEIPTHWLSYVVVDTIKAAYERVKAQGGKVMVDHIDVPGIGAIGVIQDNVGAVVGVFEQPAK